MSTISQSGGTIYVRQNGSFVEYSTNSQINWNIITNIPLTIINNNPTSNNVLNVIFTTNLTLNLINFYFICGSNYITFNGKYNTCTFNNIINCLGLIRNGTNINNGFSNITVKNINTTISGNTLLNENQGWICQSFFGKGSTDILIDACSSVGTINRDCGGICGRISTATITNCYSNGVISGLGAGGICGALTGSGATATVTITNCYSTGAISGNDSGGICGYGATVGSIITNCYSTGTISGNANGICGHNSTATINNCYVANGTWLDVSANANLLGYPTVEKNPGDIWYSSVVNTPYLLATIIISQPSSTIVNEGNFATFSVIASGNSTLSYQWFFNTYSIMGATSSSYTTNIAGNYYVIVTNSIGSVQSDLATLYVNINIYNNNELINFMNNSFSINGTIINDVVINQPLINLTSTNKKLK